MGVHRMNVNVVRSTYRTNFNNPRPRTFPVFHSSIILHLSSQCTMPNQINTPLFQEARHTIAISILLRVELVHQARLLVAVRAASVGVDGMHVVAVGSWFRVMVAIGGGSISPNTSHSALLAGPLRLVIRAAR